MPPNQTKSCLFSTTSNHLTLFSHRISCPIPQIWPAATTILPALPAGSRSQSSTWLAVCSISQFYRDGPTQFILCISCWASRSSLADASLSLNVPSTHEGIFSFKPQPANSQASSAKKFYQSLFPAYKFEDVTGPDCPYQYTVYHAQGDAGEKPNVGGGLYSVASAEEIASKSGPVVFFFIRPRDVDRTLQVSIHLFPSIRSCPPGPSIAQTGFCHSFLLLYHTGYNRPCVSCGKW